MKQLNIKHLGKQDYLGSWQAMIQFTNNRDKDTEDELWIVEHPPVFTLGQAGKKTHILDAHDIEIVESDRGGQVTYHGPGQIVVYLLIDIKRLGKGARQLVSIIEESIIASLNEINIPAFAKKEAPGVYVLKKDLPETSAALSNDAKIAALGLRIRKGCSYHGLSLNFDMDLTPFSYINPCGYEGQAVCQVKNFERNITKEELVDNLVEQLSKRLNAD